MTMARFLVVAWWLQLKMRSRSSFEGLLSIVWPVFFATSVFMMYRHGSAAGPAMLSAAVGASVMGIWSSVSTTASQTLQSERRLGTLEFLVAAPMPFPVLILPITLSMATIGLYSMIVTLIWGRVAFGIHIAVHSPVLFVVSTLITVLSIAVFGLLLAVASVRYRAAWAVGSTLEVPVWLLCGFLIAVQDLPSWVQPLSWILPPTWGMSAIRAAAEGGNPYDDLALCLGVSTVYLAGGILLAGRMINSARAHATLALT